MALSLKPGVVLTGLLLTLALVDPAAAQCDPAAIAGAWAMIGSNNGVWANCTVTAEADGSITGRCFGTGRPTRGSKVEGNLELAADCGFTGLLTGRGFEQEIIAGQLAPSQEIGAGILRFGPEPKNLGLHFTLVRQ